ncbi:MAG: hypothetical protein JWM31_2216, partial [Solirubrobacterales bacterium]|nr:hypothetical protein [Solirubrobacterales bacterium]
ASGDTASTPAPDGAQAGAQSLLDYLLGGP